MPKNSKSSTGSAARPLLKGSYRSLITLFHFIASVHFSYGIYYDQNYVHFKPSSDTESTNSFGGKFKYLTFLNAIVQAIYYIVALLNDFVGTNEAAPKRLPLVRRMKDFLLASLAFPLALNVGITFWTLYGIDRELVFPKELDAIFPSWLNHVMHTNICVFIVLEMCTSFRTYPSRKRGLTTLTIFMLCYLVWLHIVKYNAGYWVYPVLNVLDLWQRIIFFAVVLVFTLGLYLFGEVFNGEIWAKELKLAQRKTN